MKTMILFLCTILASAVCSAQWITVQDWKEYKAECWKDSSVLCVSMTFGAVVDSIYLESFHSWVPAYSTKSDTTWTRRPPTFEGFMDWMEKKPNIYHYPDLTLPYKPWKIDTTNCYWPIWKGPYMPSNWLPDSLQVR